MNVTVPAVGQALLDALRAHWPDAKAVHIDFGRPTGIPPQRTRFYLLDEENFRRVRRAAYTTETYELPLQVELKTTAGTAKECSDQRWALVDEVDAIVGASPFRRYIPDDGGIVSGQSTHVAWEKGWIAATVLRISVRARA